MPYAVSHLNRPGRRRAAAARSTRRFLRQTNANAMMLSALMIFPMMGFIGAGVDMSRVYLVRTRLQAACDAGVLAARKAETGVALSTAARDRGEEFFLSNFGTGEFETRNMTFAMTMAGSGVLSGDAHVELQSTMMSLFGYGWLDVDANCAAHQNIGDTDIMFVLDTTGSMADTNPGDSKNRFESMKDAVVNFHTTLEAAKIGSTRIRYGFVPYSQNVAVGYLLKPEWMAMRWKYQSREPAGTGSDVVMAFARLDETFLSGTQQKSSYSFTAESCNGVPNSTINWNETVISETKSPYAGPPAGETVDIKKHSVGNGKYYTWSFSGSVCTVNLTEYIDYTVEFTDRFWPVSRNLTYWNYYPIEYDVSAFRGTTVPGKLTATIGTGHTDMDAHYVGCIEERKTVYDPTYDPIPADALDLDIDLVPSPSAPETQWGPSIPELTYYRGSYQDEMHTYADYDNFGTRWGGAEKLCTTPAAKLDTMTSMQVQDYVDKMLPPAGSTHHDIGLLWGARLLSPSGIFAAENKGKQARHLIFMTDGQIDTNAQVPDAYGVPYLDLRRYATTAYPDTATMNGEVQRRFDALCKQTKARGITIWIIAFGTTVSPAMTNCAGADRTFKADDATQLKKAFDEISGKIAQLRLVD